MLRRTHGAHVGRPEGLRDAHFAWEHRLCIYGERYQWRQWPLHRQQEAPLFLPLELALLRLGGYGSAHWIAQLVDYRTARFGGTGESAESE